MTQISLPLLKLLNNPFPNGIATRYQGGHTFIKEPHQLPEVGILDLTECDVAVYNPLDQDKLPKSEVKQGEATTSIFGRRLNWPSFVVDAVLPFPVLGDVRCALDNEGNIFLILLLVAAFDAVIVSCAGLDVNNLKAFVLACPRHERFLCVFSEKQSLSPCGKFGH